MIRIIILDKPYNVHKLLILLIILNIFCCRQSAVAQSYDSWKQCSENKKGTLAIHYRDTAPFLVFKEGGRLDGVEYDILMGFQKFVKNQYGVDLELEWKREGDFQSVYNHFKNKETEGEIGVSIVSWTEERAKEVGFSVPYFPDLQVMVSRSDAPVLSSLEDFQTQFNDYTAITVLETTYEHQLIKLKSSGNLKFKINYVPSSPQIIGEIIRTPKSFGYVDLPNYLIALQQQQLVFRQSIEPIKGRGYCVIFGKNSDWNEPFNAYFISEYFDTILKASAEKHLGNDLMNIVDELLSSGINEEISMLKKEKEATQEALSNQLRETEHNTMIRNVLLVGLLIIIIQVLILFNRNRVKSKANEILTVHRDMIERHNTQLEKKNDDLVNLNHDKNNFIRILSHDLRAPINNVIGLTKVIKMEGNNLSSEQIEILQHISNESERLNLMIKRILDVEKIESNQEEKYNRINLSELIIKSGANFDNQANGKKIRLNYAIKPDIYILSLEEYVYHIFDNLISNAIKFSPHGKDVYISAKRLEKVAEIVIQDEGPGLTEDDQEKLFRKFQQLSAKPTGGEHSTGIGLSIVYKYVMQCKGTITYQDIHGKGATFLIHIPLA